jgi:hypothetical protein
MNNENIAPEMGGGGVLAALGVALDEQRNERLL